MLNPKEQKNESVLMMKVTEVTPIPYVYITPLEAKLRI